MIANILITGPPGIGKTTFIEKVLTKIKPSSGGFYTREIREGRKRVGFKIIALDGEEEILAHVDIDSSCNVGKYGVNIEGLRGVGVQAVAKAIEKDNVVVIDEIGKMELCLSQFKQVVDDSLNSNKTLLATIGKIHNSYVEEIKRRGDVSTIELTLSNRDKFIDGVVQMVNKDS